jgi:hypothetical protein
MGCYNPPPLKEISPRDCSECIKASGGGVVTAMEGTRGSWITGSLHVPTWLHLWSDHSIVPCTTD